MDIKNVSIEELEQELQQVEKQYKADELSLEFKKILENYRGEDEVIDAFKAKQFIDEIEKKEKNSWKMFSKIPQLDYLSGGFHPGNLIILTGLTGQGKTCFSQTLTKNFSENNFFSLWFTYEVTLKDFLEKFGDDLPCFCVPKNLIDNKIVWIERKIVEAIVKYNIKVVFIDHLHYLLNLQEKQNISFAIGEIMQKIKTIALKYNIAIVLITHLTKTKFEEAIKLDDIRDSSFIAQYSDFVIAIWRLTYEERKRRDNFENGIKFRNEAVLSVLKNRFSGKLGNIKLSHNQTTGLFEVFDNNKNDNEQQYEN